MATHFVCQSTEPLAHRYPSGLGGKSHGAVSQYEVYNTAAKPHTRFPPPGWDFSHSSEDDSLPLLQSVPQPVKSTSFLYDADLCITPLKSKGPSVIASETGEEDIFKKPDVNPDPDLTLTPVRELAESLKPRLRSDCDKSRKQKVRFDLDSSVTDQCVPEKLPQTSPERPYKPELYDDDDEEGFVIDNLISEKPEYARTVKYTVGKVNDKPIYVPVQQSMNEDFESQVEKTSIPTQKVTNSQFTGPENIKVIRENPGNTARQIPIKAASGKDGQPKGGLKEEEKDHIAACKVSEKTRPVRKAKVLRENQYTPKETEYTYPFKENGIDEYAGGEEHVFARPEYNSTLRMKLEAERMKEASVDLETALQKKLKMSEMLKTEINEKAAVLVNAEGKAFSGLVSLNVPVEELCKEAVEIKTARAKQVKLPRSKSKVHKEPDLLEFFCSDRQKGSVAFSLPGISPPTEQLSTASHWGAFDLYKHNRAWDRAGKM